MTWIVYTRVSTDEQATQGASLPAQVEACCGYLKYSMSVDDIIEICDPGLSGKSLKRPGIEQILSLVDSGAVEGVCVWKLDRLTRKTRDLLDLVEIFRDKGVALASVQERIDTSGPMGAFMLTVMGAIAQLEREQIAERTSLGMRARMRAGKWVGGPVPPGLKVIDSKDGGRELVIDKVMGPLMSRAWEKVLAGKSLSVVCSELAVEGLTPGGKRISKQRMGSLIKNERYIGLLVEEPIFNEVNQRLSGRQMRQRENIQRHGERHFLLKDIMVCRGCGGKMIGSSSRGMNGTVYYYYRCTNQVQKDVIKCRARALPAADFEQFVVERLSFTLQNEHTLTREIGRTLLHSEDRRIQVNADLDELIAKRDKVGSRIDKLLDFFMEENIDDRKAFGNKIKTLQKEADELDKKIGAINGQLAAVDVKTERINAVAFALASYGKKIMTLNEEQLAQALPLLVHQIIASTDYLEVQINKPSAVLGAEFDTKWLPSLDCDQKISFAWELETKQRGGVGSVIVNAVSIVG